MQVYVPVVRLMSYYSRCSQCNGEVVTELGTKIKRTDEVKFHDEPVSIERKLIFC